MEESANITGRLVSTNYKVSPILAGGLEVPLLLTFSVKSERILRKMRSFVNDLYDYEYTWEQAENNQEESGGNEEIYVKLTGQENVINENNENVTEID